MSLHVCLWSLAAVGPGCVGRGRRSGNNSAVCTGSRCDWFCDELCKAPRPRRQRDSNGLMSHGNGQARGDWARRGSEVEEKHFV